MSGHTRICVVPAESAEEWAMGNVYLNTETDRPPKQEAAVRQKGCSAFPGNSMIDTGTVPQPRRRLLILLAFLLLPPLMLPPILIRAAAAPLHAAKNDLSPGLPPLEAGAAWAGTAPMPERVPSEMQDVLRRQTPPLHLEIRKELKSPAASEAGEQRFPTILYINSYHPGNVWSDMILNGIRESMSGYYGKDYDLRVEYLDAKRYGSMLHGELGEVIRKTWHSKYKHLRIDLLLVSDQDGYDFVGRLRNELFPDVPLVFAGVEAPGVIAARTTGVLAGTDYAGNLALIQSAIPGIKELWVITDPSTTGTTNRGLFAAAARPFAEKVAVNYFDEDNRGLTQEELIRKAAAMPKGTAVFVLDYYRAPNNAAINISEFLSEFCDKASVPVFSHVDLHLGLGIAGGLMNSGEVQGRQMAAMGIRVLNGTEPSAIRPEAEQALPFFDARVLKRFSIREENLPPHGIIQWKSENFFVRYMHAIAVILAEAFLLALLFILLKRKKKFQTDAEAERRRFRQFFNDAPIPMANYNLNGSIQSLNHRFAEDLGWTADDLRNLDDWWRKAYPDADYRIQVINQWQSAVSYSMATGVIVSPAEFYIRRKDGTSGWYLLSASMLGETVLVSFLDVTERKQSEESLRESESKARAILDQSSLFIGLLTLDGTLIDVNEAALALVGTSRNAVLNKRFWETPWWSHSTVLQSQLRAAVKAAAAGETVRFEATHPAVDGSLRDVDFALRPAKDESGNTFFLIPEGLDVTERKKSEESRKKYQELYLASRDGIATVTLEGDFLDVNAAYMKLVGYDLNELRKMNLTELTPPKWHPIEKEILLTQVIPEGYALYEKEYIHKDGHIFPVELAVYLTHDKTGTPSGFLGFIRDITERKRVHEALLLSEQRFRTLFEYAPVMINGFDDAGRCVLWNATCRQVFGWTKEEMSRHANPLVLLYPDPAVRDGVLRTVTTSPVGHFSELHPVTKDGRELVTMWANFSLADGTVINVGYDVTERKTIEDELASWKKRYDLIVACSGQVAYEYDLKTSGILWGDSITDVLGYSSEEMSGGISQWVDSLHPDDKDKTLAYLDQAEKACSFWDAEYRMKHKNGRYAWIRDRGFFVGDASGKAQCQLGLIEDITERKRAEEALRESERKLMDTIQFLPDPTLAIDREKRITIWNKAIEAMTGIPASEMIGRGDYAYTIPFYGDRRPQLMDLIFEEATETSAKYANLTRQGDTLVAEVFCNALYAGKGAWVFVKASPLYDTSGRIIGAIESVRDITDRKRAEEAMRLNEQRLAILLELNNITSAAESELTHFAMEAAVRLTGSAIGYIAFANDDETVLTIHAWSGEAMQECALQDKPFVYKTSETGLWGEPVRQRRAVMTNDYAAPSPLKKGMPEGHVALTRHLGVPVFDGDRIVIVAGVGNKPTDYGDDDARQLTLLMSGLWSILRRKRSEEAVEEAHRQLEAKNKELEQIVYIASHDLRSPLVNVDGFSRKLERTLSELIGLVESDRGAAELETVLRAEFPGMTKSIERICASTKQMDNLLKALLKLSRVGRAALNLEVLDMNEVLDRLTPSFAFRLQEGGIELRVETLPPCRADAVQMTQVFANLIDNAIKYLDTSRPGVITIRGDVEKGRTIYRVEDNGQGIAADHLEKIFELFYRLDPRATEGEGIGLTMVRQILVRMQGNIRVESEFGKGSTFLVSLPSGKEKRIGSS